MNFDTKLYNNINGINRQFNVYSNFTHVLKYQLNLCSAIIIKRDIGNAHQKSENTKKEKNFCEDSEKPAPWGLTRLTLSSTLAEKFLAMADSFTGRMSVQRYVDILSDAGFKAVFGDQRNKDVLIDLLNFILPENRKVRADPSWDDRFISEYTFREKISHDVPDDTIFCIYSWS